MSPEGFEFAIPAWERQQTHALDRVDTETLLKYRSKTLLLKNYGNYNNALTLQKEPHLPNIDLGTRRGWVVNVPPRPPLPLGKTWYPLYRRLGGPQGRSGQVRKISPPNSIRSPDVPARSESLYRPGVIYGPTAIRVHRLTAPVGSQLALSPLPLQQFCLAAFFATRLHN
jgi:hypothetical protein